MNESQATEKNPGGMTALHLAAAYGDQEKVGQLLQEGTNPNQLNTEGQPPLFNVLELSMADGPEVIPQRDVLFRTLWHATAPETRLTQDKEGNTVLQLMAVHGFDALTREILEQAPQLASRYMNTTREYPIHTAILNGQLKVMEALFDLDPETPTYKTFKNQSALHYAARYGSLQMITLCCTHRAGDIDEKDNAGKTPLTWAKEENSDDVYDYLIEQGANSDLIDSRSTTRVTR